jgi:hypothetical protein
MTPSSGTIERPSGTAPRTWRRRGLRLAAAAAAAAGLVTGLATAAGILNGSGTGSASTGSVTLGIDAPATQVCSYGSLLPGNLAGAGACTLAVTYTGSIPAYLSLTVQVQAVAGAGGEPLYDGTNSTGLTLLISDGHHPFTAPAGPGVTGGSCPATFTCWTAANDLAAWYSDGTPNLTFGSGDAFTATATPLFPDTAGNAYQGGAATVTLTVQAVQEQANPLPAACTVATIGQPCPATGGFTWS